MRIPRLVPFAAMALVASLLAPTSRADVSTSTLTGVVTDPSGAPLPGATVTVKSEARGTSSTTVTNAQGEYRFPLLRPELYTVSVAMSGFQAETKAGVKLALGTTAKLDFALRLSSVEVGVTVTAEAPLVDSTAAQVGFNVAPKQIESLPLNGRNYLELALLAPGVSFARDGYSPAAFGAQEGRAVNVQVDGVDNNDESVGGQQTDISQDTVQEFQIVSSQFTAEYGKASGGIINVVTKSGTNDVHGSAAYYLRRDSLDAKDFFAADQPELKQDNAVFTLGGPIVKNRTFFFASFDYTKKQQATTVSTGNPELDGTFPLPFKQTLASGKIDHQFSDKNHLTVGYHLDNKDTGNLAVGGIYAESYGYSRSRRAWGANASLNTILSSRSYNEARVAYLYSNTDYVQNSSAVGQHFPDYYIGQNYFMPQAGKDKKFQILDNFSTILDWHGEHQVKVGFSYANWRENATFSLTSGGSIFYNSDDESDPYLYLKGYGDPTANPTVQFYAGFLQDQWKMGHLTLNLGVRYDYQPGTANADFRSAYPFIQTAKEDRTQFSPRLGFAWDPGGDGKSVVRGGWGMFYYQLYNNLALDQDIFNGTTYRIAEFDCSADPSLCDKNHLPDPTQGSVSPPLIRTLAPDVKTPYTMQYSLGFQRQLGSVWSVGVDVLWIRGLHELYERNLNVCPDVDPNDETHCLETNPYWPVLHPEVGRIRQIDSDATSDYKALEITVNKRLSDNFALQVAYTYSHAINETDGFYIPIPDSSKPISFQEGPAASDQRHRLVVNGSYNLPLGFQIAGIWKYGSGQPWNAMITGGDTNGDGGRRDRLPTDARNNQLSNAYSRLDLRLSKTFKLGPAAITLIGEMFNVFNRRNYDPGGVGLPGGYVNNRCSAYSSDEGCTPNPDFGTPGSPSFPDNYSQRELQLAARVSF